MEEDHDTPVVGLDPALASRATTPTVGLTDSKAHKLFKDLQALIDPKLTCTSTIEQVSSWLHEISTYAQIVLGVSWENNPLVIDAAVMGGFNPDLKKSWRLRQTKPISTWSSFQKWINQNNDQSPIDLGIELSIGCRQQGILPSLNLALC